MGVLLICVLVFTVFCIVCTVLLYSFVYLYLFLFILYELVLHYCHRVTTQLQLVIITIIIIYEYCRNIETCRSVRNII
jgi:hypothetical protein